MSILDTIIGVLAPHDCLLCGTEGQLLCAACAPRLPRVSERCYKCRRFSRGFLTCTVCRAASSLHGVGVVTAYKGAAKTLIWQLKLSGARTAAKIMAWPLSELASSAHSHTIIVPVPTATGRMRQRGYDQAKLLARAVARQTGLPYGEYLARSGQTHQHGVSRTKRLIQLHEAFRVTRPRAVYGARIILVDDVITTGATLEAAAMTLAAAGAQQVHALAFAQP